MRVWPFSCWWTSAVVLDFSLFFSIGITNHSKKILKFFQYVDIKFDKIRRTYHKFYRIYSKKNWMGHFAKC